MGTVTIQSHTTLHPIAMIGEEAGICWGADTSSVHKNIKRGKSCLKSGHLRTAEYPVVTDVTSYAGSTRKLPPRL